MTNTRVESLIASEKSEDLIAAAAQSEPLRSLIEKACLAYSQGSDANELEPLYEEGRTERSIRLNKIMYASYASEKAIISILMQAMAGHDVSDAKRTQLVERVAGKSKSKR